MSAWKGGSARAMARSRPLGAQSSRSISALTTRGLVSVVRIRPSEPGSKRQSPRSMGSRLEGVPLKPTRVSKSTSAPRSMPEADTLRRWKAHTCGNTKERR